MEIEEKNVSDTSRNTRIAIGALVVVLLLLGGFMAWRMSQPDTVSEKPLEERIGTLNLQAVIEAHPDFGRLQQLKDEAKVLEADISIHHMNMKFIPPEPDKEAFDKASRDKQNLDRIKHYTELMEKVRQAEAEKRAEMAPQFEAEVKAVEGRFLNEILNIRIKLDNARALRLSEDDVNQKVERLKELQQLRGKAVMELKKNQEEEIQRYVEEIVGDGMAELKKYAAELNNRTQAEELILETEAQKRNAALMEQGAVTPLENRVRIAQKTAALAAKKQEIRLLEDHIFKDVSGIASKLAIVNHLTLIISDTVPNRKGQEYDLWKLGKWTELRSPIIGINTLDLTDEMLKEMADKAAAQISQQAQAMKEK